MGTVERAKGTLGVLERVIVEMSAVVIVVDVRRLKRLFCGSEAPSYSKI